MTIKYFADYVFKNGKVITVNSNNEICGAVAVKGKEIVYVGDKKGAAPYVGPETKVVDLAGRVLVPGFIEGHMHFVVYSMMQGPIIDVVSTKAPSIEAIKTVIKNEVKKKKPGEWITLWGYDQNKLAEGRHPTRYDFDEVAPENPVKCTRACGHMSVYNSKAIEIAKVSEKTSFKPGEAVVDEKGKLTGLFKESANNLLSAEITYSKSDILKGLKKTSQMFLTYGLTGVHDVGTTGYGSSALQEAVRKGDVKQRFYAFYCDISGREKSMEFIKQQVATSPATGIGDTHYKLGAAKILLDGSTSGPSSLTKEPYSHDPNLKGIQNWPDQNEINETLLLAHKAGFQLSAHAVGDKAVEQIVTAYEYINKVEPRKDPRFRIEHCGITDPDLIKRIKKLKALPISNPAFITINGADYNKYYGDRVERFFALKTYLKNGILSGGGSDCPVAPPDPLLGIYAAVNRKDIRKNVVCGASQKIDVMDAIRMFTYNNAYLSFEENIKGSIETGKLADLVVLSEDILTCDPEKIKDIKVDMTMIDGVMEYQR